MYTENDVQNLHGVKNCFVSFKNNTDVAGPLWNEYLIQTSCRPRSKDFWTLKGKFMTKGVILGLTLVL